MYNVDGSVFRFMFFKNDNAEYEDEYRIDILDSVSGLVKRQYGRIKEPVEIDINELRNLNDEENGITTQKVEIYYNVIGKFELPTDYDIPTVRNAEEAKALTAKLGIPA